MTAGASRHVDLADYERFVAFAFAAADLVVEIGDDHRTVYAAGAFRTHLGREPDDVLHRPIKELVAPIDHELLETSLAALNGSGRLTRCVVRLANKDRTCVSLSGLALPSSSTRLCLGFSLLPSPLDETCRISPGALLRRAESFLRSRDGTLALLQLVGEDGSDISLNGQLGAALRAVLPTGLAADLSAGRIGVIDDGACNGADLAQSLIDVLSEKGIKARVMSHQLDLDNHELTPVQAARALRHAIGVFARDGAVGLQRSGFTGGLSGYLLQASTQAANLRRALREQSFDLVYQPIVSLADRRVDHYEALLRPHRVALGTARTPQDFVMMVETVGMAEELDRAVARRVCEAASVTGHGIAMNLSSQSIQNPVFRHELSQLLEHHRAAERRISVEMTETAEIEQLDEAARSAEELRRIGVSFALDDFGAGKAGIDVLRALKPDIVKFDGSYTEGVVKSSRDRALFAGMVDLVRATGARIVAERVETERETSELISLGVRFGQGWLFGRAGSLPLHAPSIEPARPNARRRQGATEMWGFRQR